MTEANDARRYTDKPFDPSKVTPLVRGRAPVNNAPEGTTGNTGVETGVPSGVPSETPENVGEYIEGNTGTPGTPINSNSYEAPREHPFTVEGDDKIHSFSETGVPGVPRVPNHAKSNGINQLQVNSEGTRPKIAGVPRVPSPLVSFGGYNSSAKGIFFTPPGDDAEPMWLCGPLKVLAMTRDIDSSQWGLFLELEDRDHHQHQVAVPREWIGKGAGEGVISLLMQLGGDVSTKRANKGHLIEYLARVNVSTRRLTVNVTGWHGNEYVTPSGVYCRDGISDKVFSASSSAKSGTAYTVSGTLESWQDQVGRLAIGNSRLMLAFGAAFAAPLLRRLGVDGGGFHFRGPSSCGKTTLAKAAASVWSDQTFTQTWRATSNGLEGVAAARNDALLILDEIGQVDPKAAGEVAYMLANGEGKVRSTRDGTTRAPVRFKVMFLSTGEISLADRVGEDRFSRGRAMAGQEIRLLDIPADTGKHGAFEMLHGHPSGAALSDHVRTAVDRHHGTAFVAFIRAIIDMTPAQLASLKDRVDNRIAQLVKNRHEGQLQRAAERFALTCIAAEVASETGVAPWSVDDAWAGIETCFEAWVSARGGTGSSESKQALRKIQHFIMAHGTSRFDMVKPYNNSQIDVELPPKVQNQAGYYFVDGEDHYYGFHAQGWREAVDGLDPKNAASDIADAGFIDRDGEGKSSTSKKVHGKKMRLYMVKGSILEAEL